MQHNSTQKKNLLTRRNIVGVIVSLLFIAFAIWAGWLWLIFLPLIIDYYFFHKIKWNWYNSIQNNLLRNICAWLCDIVCCVIGVALLNIYFFQNFAIPSSSLEKTLLVGDYLYVDKLSYGPRLPNTPLAIPLVHNTFLGGKSYSETPTLEYRRLPGRGHVEREDLVVFNFPAGDTVAVKVPNPDYYTLIALYGRDVVWKNTSEFGEIVYRPVDRRDHYVKRCVGMPGETLQIRNNDLYINGEKQARPKYMQLNYYVQAKPEGLSVRDFETLGISESDRGYIQLSPETSSSLSSMGFDLALEGGKSTFYHFPLTEEMLQKLQSDTRVLKIVVEPDSEGFTYPVEAHLGWSRDNYGPILIPKKGLTIKLSPNNLLLYKRCIEAYERHSVAIDSNGAIMIDGEAKDTYTFAMDYYFMMGDNRHNSADSRYWGFVPEDHVVGKPVLLWLSLDKDKGLFSGKIRWHRMFRKVTKW